MKKIIALLLAAALLLSLTACKAKEPEKEAETPAPTEPTPEAEPAAPTEPETEAPADAGTQDGQSAVPTTPSYVTPDELVGSWRLSADNDAEVLSAAFPEVGELGGAMEIGMDGLLFWTIGTSGGGGNFTVEDDVIKASLVSDYTGSPEPVDISLNRDADIIKLVMEYNGATIIWEQAN